MIFKYILDNAEPFALNLEVSPLRVSIRAQVILGFVALGLGKGGLFISTFLYAMAWSEDGWLIYAVPFSIITFLVMIAGYIITFGRVEAEIDLHKGVVHLTKRMPFYRHQHTEQLAQYQGISLNTHTDRDQRTTHMLRLVHADTALSVPLWQRRYPEPPTAQWDAYAALKMKKINAT